MPRGAHIDVQATAEARRARVLRDPRSFLATDGRVFLAGKDIKEKRVHIYVRDHGQCVDCGKNLLFESDLVAQSMGLTVMELSHEKPKSLGGDDSDTNLRTRCRKCHQKRDLHGEPGHF